MRSLFLAISFLTLSVAAAPARADVVSPEAEVCFGKKAGDACTTCVDSIDQATCGTCTVPPPSCQAGACRRHADEKACLAEAGCSWAPGSPYCAGAPCACNDAAKKPDAQADTKPSADANPGANAKPAEEKASSCAAAPVSIGAVLLALLLARRRR